LSLGQNKHGHNNCAPNKKYKKAPRKVGKIILEMEAADIFEVIFPSATSIKNNEEGPGKLINRVE